MSNVDVRGVNNKEDNCGSTMDLFHGKKNT